MGWAIALHGGAGDIPVTLAEERRAPREATLGRCLSLGVAALKANQAPLDVVELVVIKAPPHQPSTLKVLIFGYSRCWFADFPMCFALCCFSPF